MQTPPLVLHHVEDAQFVDAFVAPRYTGRMVRLWAAHGVGLTSAEFSDASIPSLAEYSETHKQEYVQLDIAYGHLDHQFDLIFCTQVLLHIHPREIRQTLTNLKAMAWNDLRFITGAIGPPFDAEDTKGTSSFCHDYLTLFDEVGLDLRLEMELPQEPRDAREEPDLFPRPRRLRGVDDQPTACGSRMFGYAVGVTR